MNLHAPKLLTLATFALNGFRRPDRRATWLSAWAFVALAGGWVPLNAATFLVTSSADSGAGSLRAALNAVSAGDTIAFDIAGGGAATITLNSALPIITQNITINASTQPGFAGTNLITVNGNSTSQVFFVSSGTVAISALNISGGISQGGNGGAGFNTGGGALGAGGAIFVGGTANVTVNGVQFTNNSAAGGSGGSIPGNLNAESGGGGMNGGNGGIGDGNGGGGGGGNGGNGGAGIGGTGGGGGGLQSPGGASSGGTGGTGGGPNGGTGGSFGSSGGSATGPNSGGGGAGAMGGNGGAGSVNGGGGGGSPAHTAGNGGMYGGGGGVDGNGGSGGFGGGGGAGYYTGGAGGFGGGGGGASNGTSPGGIGAGNGAIGGFSQGGGGAGLGGAVFVQQGGTLTINGTQSFTGSSVTAGTGANNGAAAGSDLFLMTGATTVFAPGTGNTTTFNGTIADDSAASLPGGSTYTAGSAAGAAITIGSGSSPGGTVVFNGANTYSGGTTLTNNAILQVGNAAAVGAGTISFTGGTLQYGTGITQDFSSQFSNAASQLYSVDTNGNNVTFATALTSVGGTFTKLGVGTLTVTAANTYNGGTTISAGTLAIGAGGDISSSSGVYLTASGATFDISGGGSQTIQDLSGVTGSTVNLGANVLTEGTGNSTEYDGVIAGVGGSLVKQGSGELVLTGASTFTGGTTINVGEILLGDGASPGASLGSGNVTVNGAGTLTLDLVNGSVFSNHVIDDGQVVLDDIAGSNYTVSSIITGTGTVEKDGANTITLTGNNNYSGGTTIDNGTLVVGNPSALGTGPVTQNNGTLQTNNVNNVITMGNGFNQAGGTLFLNLNGLPGAANNDRVNVTGTAALNGSLVINYTAGSLAPQQSETYTVITTTAGITSVNAAGYEPPTLQAGALLINITGAETNADHDFQVTLTAAQTPFLALAGTNFTPNQARVAGYFDEYDSTFTSAPLIALLQALDGVSVNPAALGPALNELTPQAFGQFASSTAFNNASFATEAMDDYLATQRAGPNGTFTGGNGSIDTSGLTINDPSYDPSLAMVHSRLLAWNAGPISHGLLSDTTGSVLGGVDMNDPKEMKPMQEAAYNDPWNFYVEGNVILAQGFSQANVGHFDDNTESVRVGTDYRVTPNLLVGLAAGYGHTDATLDNNGSSATVDSYSPGFYASYADHGWYANFSGDYIHNAYTQSRVIGFLGQTANSAPEGNEGVANLDGGYDFHRGALTFGPLAGLQYTHLTVDGFQESGSIADLSVNEQDADSLRSRVGGRVSFTFSHCGVNLTPHLDATWQHEFMDQSRGITSQFNGGVGSFSIQTANPSRDSALVDAGLDAEINQTVTVFVDYMVQAGQENYFGQSVQAGAKIGF